FARFRRLGRRGPRRPNIPAHPKSRRGTL
ncbi:uncharacterized protein METZ01_LOCUS486257, partial [marine metagenome]